MKAIAQLGSRLMVTHANGNSGYLPNDEAYENISYEILVTRVKPGVEQALIVNLLDLLKSAD